jgi:hypothetical protein
MKSYNFACSCVQVWNLISDIKGKTWIENIRKQGAVQNICTEEG